MTDLLPIQILVISRTKALGLSRRELALRTGYKNVTKAIRRLEALMRGDLASSRGLIEALPGALDITPREVADAVERSWQYLKEMDEAEWRAGFVPHAVVLTERKIPQPIFVVAIVGVERLLKASFDLSAPEHEIPARALAAVRKHLAQWSYPIPSFGKPTGYVVNYTPDRAERYALDGTLVERLPRAVRLGNASIRIR